MSERKSTRTTTRPFLVFPAIDLKGGKVVRLQQGRADAATVYSDDPAAVGTSQMADAVIDRMQKGSAYAEPG